MCDDVNSERTHELRAVCTPECLAASQCVETEASVFGTAVARSPFSLAGGKAAFGGMRNAGVRPTFDDDDDEDEDGMRVGGGGVIPDDDDDGRQKIELRESSISLEQVSGRACLPNATLTSSLGAPDRDAKCVARYEGVMAGSPCA